MALCCARCWRGNGTKDLIQGLPLCLGSLWLLCFCSGCDTRYFPRMTLLKYQRELCFRFKVDLQPQSWSPSWDFFFLNCPWEAAKQVCHLFTWFPCLSSFCGLPVLLSAPCGWGVRAPCSLISSSKRTTLWAWDPNLIVIVMMQRHWEWVDLVPFLPLSLLSKCGPSVLQCFLRIKLRFYSYEFQLWSLLILVFGAQRPGTDERRVGNEACLGIE